jgi:hypothetical protein
VPMRFAICFRKKAFCSKMPKTAFAGNDDEA